MEFFYFSRCAMNRFSEFNVNAAERFAKYSNLKYLKYYSAANRLNCEKLFEFLN